MGVRGQLWTREASYSNKLKTVEKMTVPRMPHKAHFLIRADSAFSKQPKIINVSLTRNTGKCMIICSVVGPSAFVPEPLSWGASFGARNQFQNTLKQDWFPGPLIETRFPTVPWVSLGR